MSGDEETQEQTIADDLVVTKYKMGAEIANREWDVNGPSFNPDDPHVLAAPANHLPCAAAVPTLHHPQRANLLSNLNQTH